jgi:hypothetical protein
MEMLDFSSLSLNDMIAPGLPELPDILQQQQQQQQHIDIMNSETMKELFLNLYLNEIPIISFEEMQQKLIEFYFEEATSDLITRHLNAVYNMLHESVSYHINERIMYNDYDDVEQYNLNALIEFISISEGNEYLQDIYNMHCVMI